MLLTASLAPILRVAEFFGLCARSESVAGLWRAAVTHTRIAVYWQPGALAAPFAAEISLVASVLDELYRLDGAPAVLLEPPLEG